MRFVVLDKDTPLAETLLARPPRVLGILAASGAAVLAAAAAWSAFVQVDLGVSAPVRVRPDGCPLRDFSAVSGDRVVAPIGGRVAEVRVREGDAVSRGDVLARLDETRVDADLRRGEAEERAIEEDLRRMETVLGELARQEAGELKKARTAVEEAEEAVRAESERLQADEGRRASDERLARLALEERARDFAILREQVAAGIAPRIEEERAGRAVREAQERLTRARIPVSDAAVAQARKRLALAQAGLDPVRNAFARDRAEQESRLASRRRELEDVRKQLAAWRREKADGTIAAPVDGIVTHIDIRPGDVVQAGRALAAVARNDGLRVDAAVRAEDIAEIRPGMRAKVRLDALDAQDHGALEAVVDFVPPDAQVLPDRGLVYVVRMRLARDRMADGSRIRLGMSGQADILVGRQRVLQVFWKGLKGRSISL